MGADEDLLRVVCKILAESGWFVDAKASRVGEHFEIHQCPQVGWALKTLRHDGATGSESCEPKYKANSVAEPQVSNPVSRSMEQLGVTARKQENELSTIWKYPIQPGRTELEMPEGSELLTVQMQGDTPTLWAQIWANEPMVRRVVDVYGTGHKMPPDPGEYIATFQMAGGNLVWHAFDATGTA